MTFAQIEHVAIYASLSFLLVMVLFLILVGIVHVRLLNRMALRIKYLEGTLDMICQKQEQLNKLLIAFMENE
jgi:hypothetical protein